MKLLVYIALIVLVWWLWGFSAREAEDRKKNPEKWAARDADAVLRAQERRKRACEQKERAYQDAMKPVPESVWILMSKEQRSQVFAKREKAIRERADNV